MKQVNMVVLGSIEVVKDDEKHLPEDAEEAGGTADRHDTVGNCAKTDSGTGSHFQEEQRVRGLTTIMATADAAACLWAVVYFMWYGSAPLRDAAFGFVATWNFLMLITFVFFAMGWLYCCNPLATTRGARLAYLRTWFPMDIFIVLHLLVYSLVDLRAVNAILTRLLCSLCQLVRICRIVRAILDFQEMRAPGFEAKAGLGAVPATLQQDGV
eukprot:TRINITY_DN103224_c0_g1_i1.p1 TRINITY_DN103224_c0_g1~~TRINITY_DN103224_c0_g1_i1.p1  ORF type:complete len:212 (+),score=18.15 TRINITY_DN103224_c0_g1_i1:105-740(+)